MTEENQSLAEVFEELPDDDDLWGSLRVVQHETTYGLDEQVLVESFIHERTGTKVDIYREGDGTFSVQPKYGGHNEDAVVQPDDPMHFVSGTAAVIALNEPTLGSARALAFVHLRGWAYRNATYGESEGDIRDLGNTAGA